MHSLKSELYILFRMQSVKWNGNRHVEGITATNNRQVWLTGQPIKKSTSTSLENRELRFSDKELAGRPLLRQYRTNDLQFWIWSIRRLSF